MSGTRLRPPLGASLAFVGDIQDVSDGRGPRHGLLLMLRNYLQHSALFRNFTPRKDLVEPNR
jgi:hypothetical protein